MSLDFLDFGLRNKGKDNFQIYPIFNIIKSKDLMTRGNDFYAIWDENTKLWSTDEDDAIRLIDKETIKYKDSSSYGQNVSVALMRNGESKLIDTWHHYVRYQLRENFVPLDETLIFSDQETKKTDYATKKLSYSITNGTPVAWNTLINTLYAPSEAHKIEWAIGSILSGDSRFLQKFLVFYGNRGTGKSTILNVIEKLFDGYCTTFDAKALGQMSNSFALEPFKNNPLVAIQHDGDLSHIEDNTRLNSLVSHEWMMVNEKFKAQYAAKFKTFLLMGTNRPVKITDAKSGLLRRLIDVSPTGNTIPRRDYDKLVRQVNFELGTIAYKCLNLYLDNPGYYNDYVPTNMMDASNDFFNFIDEEYFIFKRENATTLKNAWDMYKVYCEEANIQYPFNLRVFKEELKNYFYEFREKDTLPDGTLVRNYYVGFKWGNDEPKTDITPVSDIPEWLQLKEQVSEFDILCANSIAQYAGPNEKPMYNWDNVTTKLSDIDTKKLHYVRMQLQHIVIDFDIRDENGEKSLKKNIEAASKFPPTYTEVSKSGNGLHLHYIYTGDPMRLESIYKPNVEIKVFNKKASLRRLLTLCNNLPINEISSGLPLKEVKRMTNDVRIQDVSKLQNIILKAMRKEIHPDTTSNINFINKILNDAYESGLSYDLTKLRSALTMFASNSTNQSQYCMKVVRNMKLRSKDFETDEFDDSYDDENAPMCFFDVEVLPNVLLIVWKILNEDKCFRMFNPTPALIEDLFNKYRMSGYNCRKYDNHILYARKLGYDNRMVYNVSKAIIHKDGNPFYPDAYGMSYIDVLDMIVNSQNKYSLKKHEINLRYVHKEMDIDWDEDLPTSRWEELADYCENDVRATELVWKEFYADYNTRLILSKMSGKRVNDTTNTHTTVIVFGNDKHPQKEFNYRFMGDLSDMAPMIVPNLDCDWNYTVFDSKGRPLFPGYKFENGVSYYRDEEIGEGGYVYAEPGFYRNVALLDVASMHPTSIVAENLFGDKYTKHYKDLLDLRLAIKHKDFNKARSMFNGSLAQYLTDEKSAKELSKAIKVPINAVYGQTCATYDNPFKDERNIDNIVAKRGELFMINLKHEVQSKGFTVAHIKTDSIKIPNATPEIIQFVFDYGKLYGYIFEHEATYKKMCLVNDAVYIAQYANDGHWEATGKQFAVPFVFKTLFNKEPIDFYDMCEVYNCNTCLYLDSNEKLIPEGTIDTNYADKSKHNLQFIGRVGQFTPVKDGYGGGSILRKNSLDKLDQTYSYASGSKGYKWLESLDVKAMFDSGKDIIDLSYYNDLVNKAVAAIEKYVDIGEFVYE